MFCGFVIICSIFHTFINLIGRSDMPSRSNSSYSREQCENKGGRAGRLAWHFSGSLSLSLLSLSLSSTEASYFFLVPRAPPIFHFSCFSPSPTEGASAEERVSLLFCRPGVLGSFSHRLKARTD